MKATSHIKALRLRKRGYSIAEIHRHLNVALSTISGWVRGVPLSLRAKKRLRQRGVTGRAKGAQTRARKQAVLLARLRREAERDLHAVPISRVYQKLLCTLLLRCEGEKTLSHVAFINSDPALIGIFLWLLREVFTIDEKKFRVSLHLHSYHQPQREKRFWSQLTKVPVRQFYKVYRKSNTGKAKHPGYHGCVSIRYYDHAIAKELDVLWQVFIKKHGRVV